MKKSCLFLILCAFLSQLFFTHCDKGDPPEVNTLDVSEITGNSALVSGSVISEGGSAVTARGVCRSTEANPTTANLVTLDGSGAGSYSSTIVGLSDSTTYHVRAYAVNSGGTSYGKDVSFTTKTKATLTTATVSSITTTTAVSGGIVTSDGGQPVIARGACWSTGLNPTLMDSKTIDGSGTGAFSSTITGLSEGTAYHVRAYATNSVGTTYGNDLSFTTITKPSVGILSASVLTLTTANVSGIVLSDGGSPVTARGICWGTQHNPSITGNTTTQGTGSGNFTDIITGLVANTFYYIRAYATNSAGTVYSDELSFQAYALSDIDNNFYHTVTIGTQTWMAENLKVTRTRADSAFNFAQTNIAWSSTYGSLYTWYNNDATSNKSTYGAIYNWYAAHQYLLCPDGWHVPTTAEWTTLINYLGGSTVAGDKMKETGNSHWTGTNTSTNSSGFTALPGGRRMENGSFTGIGQYGEWWSSTQYSDSTGTNITISYNDKTIYTYNPLKKRGYSVRCVKN